MNIGGNLVYEGISVTMTQAFHSSATGSPCGYIIRLEDGTTLYHAGDTGLFDTMRTFGELYPIDVAMLPIGSVFTMDPLQAARAVRLLSPKKVIPMHFKTFPILVQDASGFMDLVGKEAPGVEIVSLNPGEEYLYSK
jgi:L-ascorbate metabolism protein UlaG (beta-lactamase superfamily)